MDPFRGLVDPLGIDIKPTAKTAGFDGDEKINLKRARTTAFCGKSSGKATKKGRKIAALQKRQETLPTRHFGKRFCSFFGSLPSAL